MTVSKPPLKSESSALNKEIASIGKNSSVYLIGQILSRAVGFFMIPLYTRFISPTNYGVMEMIEILTGSIAMIVSINISDSLPRFYYAEKDEETRNKIISTSILGLGLIGLPIVLFFLLTSKYLAFLIADEAKYTFYLQISIVTCWFGILCEIGYTYLRMKYMAKTFVLITMANLALALSLNIYFIIFLNLDILGVFYSTLITQGLTALILTIWILKGVPLQLSIHFLKKLIAFGLPLVPSRIGLSLGFVSNRFFLRWFGASDPVSALALVGLFSLGHKFGAIVNRFITIPFNSFWGPRRMELLLSVSDSSESRETVAGICTYSTMISLYFALILSSGIENIIEIMADPSYKNSHIIVPFVALSYVALGLETHFSAGILQLRKTTSATFISLLSLAIILLWNYIFIPIYGIYGAVTSNLAGFAVRCILTYLVSQRLYHIPFEIRRIMVLFLAACILYFLSQLVVATSPYVTMLLRISVAASYPLALFFIGFYHEKELIFAGQCLQKIRTHTKALCNIKVSS